MSVRTRPRALFTGLRRKSDNENLIINTLLKLKASGLKDTTIKRIDYKLTRINNNADLNKPEEVKLYVANLKVANSYKQAILKAYTYFTAINQIE